ncbi:hypothetical protein [Coraliomargarita sinensis]|uniref:hypothetical protein n=1 Tax=Coraliomargarita sinensis TaxID=2174842 RepID=UPI001304E418|nr:hypothetical protein [Coraliomargarita sinensis]
MSDFCEIGQTKPEAICQSCGSNWSDLKYKNECPECGGGALQVPCPDCSGTCGSMWDRAVLDSNDSGKAHWIGQCYHKADRFGGPDIQEDSQQRYLFRFGYHNKEQLRLNAVFNDDAECSEWIFIETSNKREAAELGRLYADLFIMKLFEADWSNLRQKAYLWSEAGFAEWIEEDLQEIAHAEQAKVPLVKSPQDILKVLLD